MVFLFRLKNMTFPHHRASVDGIQSHYIIVGHGDCSFIIWMARNTVCVGIHQKPLTGYDEKTMTEDIHQLVTQLGFKIFNFQYERDEP